MPEMSGDKNIKGEEGLKILISWSPRKITRMQADNTQKRSISEMVSNLAYLDLHDRFTKKDRKKVQVSYDQEMAQSERNSHSINLRVGKN